MCCLMKHGHDLLTDDTGQNRLRAQSSGIEQEQHLAPLPLIKGRKWNTDAQSPELCVFAHKWSVPALVLRPFNVWHWKGLKWWHRRVSPKVFLVHFPCQQNPVTPRCHCPELIPGPHLRCCSLKGTLLAKPIFLRHVHCLVHLSKSSNWLITRFFSSWSRPLTPFKCFEINAFLGVVPAPAYLSSLSLQLHNVLCQPEEYFSSVSKPKDKVSFCFLRVWPVIGILCMKFILLLSSVWVLNWVLVLCFFFLDPHKRGINKLGLSLLKSNISHMHFFWESKGEGCLFSLMEVVPKSNALVVKQRIYVEMGRWMKQWFPDWVQLF